MSAGITVVPVAAEHRAAWEELYAGYAAFYRVEQTAAMRATVWGWLFDPAHEVEGLVALGPGGAVIGIAHYRPFARPLAASVGGFLDDLFVAPEARGSGAAQALIRGVAERGPRARLDGDPLDHGRGQLSRPGRLRPGGGEDPLAHLRDQAGPSLSPAVTDRRVEAEDG